MLNEECYYTLEQLNNCNDEIVDIHDFVTYEKEDCNDLLKEERETFCADYGLNSVEFEDMDALDMENELMTQDEL